MKLFETRAVTLIAKLLSLSGRASRLNFSTPTGITKFQVEPRQWH